jgi:deoxyadenosine/deoxycytidine kinase
MPERFYNYIAIEGNIGSGKTSLAQKITEEYNARLILERFEDNSFLPKFYKNPEQYAFPLEMSFLADRYQQLKDELTKQDLFKTFTIADYFIDKSLIFARKNLQNDEYSLYSRLFTIINSTLKKPELIFYLHNSVDQLLLNIKERGRNYEQEIKASYLEMIQTGYFEYFKQTQESRIVILNTEKIDFVNNPTDYSLLKSCIFKHYNPGIHRINSLYSND